MSEKRPSQSGALPSSTWMYTRGMKEPEKKEVIPPKDNPFSWWQKLGWSFLSRRVWPKDCLYNAFFFYFVGRKESRHPTRIFPLVVFLSLTFVELLFLFVVVSNGYDALQIMLYLGFLEAVFLPFSMVFFSALLTHMTYQRYTTVIENGELVSCSMPAKDLVYSIAGEYSSTFGFSLLVNTVLMLMALGVSMAATEREGIVVPIGAGVIFLILIYRFYAMRTFFDLGTVLMIRALFFIRVHSKSIARTFRDALVYSVFNAIVTFILVCLISVFALISGVSGGFIYIVLIPIGLVFLGLGSGVVEMSCKHVLEWTCENQRFWSIYTMSESRLAPDSMWKNWNKDAR